MTIEDFEKGLMTIEKFVETEKPTIYFACKALNYRAEKDKWDGDRRCLSMLIGILKNPNWWESCALTNLSTIKEMKLVIMSVIS